MGQDEAYPGTDFAYNESKDFRSRLENEPTIAEPNDYVVVSEAFLEEYKTKNGAWTRRQLELIGVNWPPAKNWKRKVIGKIDHQGIKLTKFD